MKPGTVSNAGMQGLIGFRVHIASLVELVKNALAMQETLVRLLSQEDPLERDRLLTPVFLGFPCGSDGKDSACNVGDLGSIPGSGRFPGRGHGNPLQYSCLENPMDRGAWWATVHGSTESDTTEHFHMQLFSQCRFSLSFFFF